MDTVKVKYVLDTNHFEILITLIQLATDRGKFLLI